MKRLPGFRYDSRAKRASFEVIVPGTKGGVRWRETADAAVKDGEPCGSRTRDPLLKRQVLYRLS